MNQPNQQQQKQNKPKNPGKGKGKGGGGRPYNPLEPMTPKQLRYQAQHTMNAIFKPEFAQLNREQQRIESIAEKRKIDNQYYLNWLNTQNQSMTAHEDASRAALAAAGQKAQEEITQGYQDLHNQLLESGQQQPGVVSSPGQANAFDVSGAYAHAQGLNQAAEAQTRGQIATSIPNPGARAANNFAQIAASEAKNVASRWKALAEFGDKKQQLRLTKAAETAKEVSRLLDREIQKAQVRGQIQASKASAALSAAKFGLDTQKLHLAQEEFGYEQYKTNRKFGLEKSKYGLEREKAAETKRYHQVEAHLKQAENHQEKVKYSHKITGIIQEGVSTIASSSKIKKLIIQKQYRAAQAQLQKIIGSATAAGAAVELFTHGTMSSTTREELEQIGYIVPPKWRR